MSGIEPTAAAFEWAADMFTVGVTGTNGKTSTTHLIAACLAAAGRACTVMSTVRTAVDGIDRAPPASLQGMYDLLQDGVAQGARDAVIEVTSRALAHGYAKRWRFDLGVFTNLSPDHLTTHGTWENYLAAKAQLFIHLAAGKTAVLNAGDRHAWMLDKAIGPDVVRRWFWAPGREPVPDLPLSLRAQGVRIDADGTEVTLEPSPDAEALGGQLRVRMIGDVFAENALAAASAGLAMGLPGEAVARGLAQCPVVPGRFEVVARDPLCVVDYAHSPDALARTCDTARQLSSGRVVVVFGAGGGSTPDKRGPMGETVGTRADVAFVTTDSPRDEPADQIAAMVADGVRAGGRAQVRLVQDRRTAIANAIDEAEPGDVVVVAGRGHERRQQIGAEIIEYTDAEAITAHREPQ